jgi:hypothetical protein
MGRELSQNPRPLGSDQEWNQGRVRSKDRQVIRLVIRLPGRGSKLILNGDARNLGRDQSIVVRQCDEPDIVLRVPHGYEWKGTNLLGAQVLIGYLCLAVTGLALLFLPLHFHGSALGEYLSLGHVLDPASHNGTAFGKSISLEGIPVVNRLIEGDSNNSVLKRNEFVVGNGVAGKYRYRGWLWSRGHDALIVAYDLVNPQRRLIFAKDSYLGRNPVNIGRGFPGICVPKGYCDVVSGVGMMRRYSRHGNPRALVNLEVMRLIAPLEVSNDRISYGESNTYTFKNALPFDSTDLSPQTYPPLWATPCCFA